MGNLSVPIFLNVMEDTMRYAAANTTIATIISGRLPTTANINSNAPIGMGIPMKVPSFKSLKDILYLAKRKTPAITYEIETAAIHQ